MFSYYQQSKIGIKIQVLNGTALSCIRSKTVLLSCDVVFCNKIDLMCYFSPEVLDRYQATIKQARVSRQFSPTFLRKEESLVKTESFQDFLISEGEE